MQHSIYKLKLNIPNEIVVVFHKGLKYDFHLIVKELGNETDGQFDCIAENSEKYKTFSVPVTSEAVKIDKDGNKAKEFISSNIKFIDRLGFVATSLSNLVDNLSGRIDKLKCKNCDCFLEYKNFKSNLTEYNCSFCNKDFSIGLDRELKRRFKNFK